MEAEWHVLTLLKIHVRTSHVSCLTHIFGGVRGGGHLEAVAQCPAYMCGYSLNGAELAVRYELGPNSMLPTPTHLHTHTHPLLLVMSPRISNQHGCITRGEVCLIDGCMKSPLLCCVFVCVHVAMKCVCVRVREGRWG